MPTIIFILVTLTTAVLIESNSADEQYCANIFEKDTFDCHPEPHLTRELCEERGCCWRDYPESHGQPFCFFPSNQPSYTLLHWTETNYGYEGILKKDSLPVWPLEVNNVTLKVWFETQTRLRIKVCCNQHQYLKHSVTYHDTPILQFYDSTSPRWEVPLALPPLPAHKPAIVDYEVQYIASPFGLKVTRKSTGALLFDSTIATSPFIFSDQFFQFSTRLSSPLVYGIGERYGSLLINTSSSSSSFQRFSLWNRDQMPAVGANLYGSHAFLINPEEGSTNNHAIFMLNSNAMEIEVQHGSYVTWRGVGGVVDMYLFTGPSADEVVMQYVQTVGLPTLPPLWSLGFHLCRWKYHSTERLRIVVERNKRLGISYDAQWSDIDYMDGAKIWTVDQSQYSDLPDLVQELHQSGQRYVIIVDPAVALDYPVYERGMERGVFVRDAQGNVLEGKVWPGTTAFPDFSHPNASDWWFEEASTFHPTLPYDGLWIDMNEPSNFVRGSCQGCSTGNLDKPPYTPRVTDGDLAAQTLCPSSQHHLSSHYNLHNMYGLQEAIATKEALSRLKPNKRSFILSRSTFPSQGKYSFHWTGDVASKWIDLQYSIPGILSFQWFGIPMVGADVCGFSGDTTEELCVRWMQLGAFYPFMRNHNDDKSRDQDPAVWSEEARQAMKKATQIRYSLLPFFYTQFFHNHLTGAPVVRPLFFVYPDDKETYGIESQFLWGKSLLVSPALEEGQRTVRAYFPKDDWFNLFTSRPIRSQGVYLNLDTPLNSTNLHLRAGSVLAWQEAALTTVAQRGNSYKLTVALDRHLQASGDLFWDDGESMDSIEGGKYSLIEFKAQESSVQSEVKEDGFRGEGELVLAEVFVLGLRSRPARVTFNNLNVPFEYHFVTGHLSVVNLKHSLLQAFDMKWF